MLTERRAENKNEVMECWERHQLCGGHTSSQPSMCGEKKLGAVVGAAAQQLFSFACYHQEDGYTETSFQMPREASP